MGQMSFLFHHIQTHDSWRFSSAHVHINSLLIYLSFTGVSMSLPQTVCFLPEIRGLELLSIILSPVEVFP